MPKPRTKRGAIREERRLKRRAEQEGGDIYTIDTKRRRHDTDENANGYRIDGDEAEGAHFEREFFGMLEDEEQELFRNMDNDLERDDFDNDQERAEFIAKVFELAKGKELKLASSQSCSRFMEKLIQRATANQTKQLFEAFASHFMTLVQHRFASHCCEALFLRAAPVVTRELAGFEPVVVDKHGRESQEEVSASSMEDLFLATLDELEGNLSFLITDRFASHVVRVLVLILSGRPLDDAAFQTLAKSKKKENVAIRKLDDGEEQALRAVPSSFTMAVKKIISDSTAGMDRTGLEILAKHPIGNPTLQLLLELDLSLNKGDLKGEDKTLLQQLLPGAPQSLGDETSDAAQFINGMIYDPIGSRIVELLISNSPGKVFKALNMSFFLPRIQGYVRNDTASYAAIRALNRMGKDSLIEAVDKILPSVPQLVTKGRFNVIRTLFERCNSRGANDQIKQLMKGLREGCGSEPADLAATLCGLKDEEKKAKDVEALQKNSRAIQNHGAQLLTTLFGIQGPSKGVQESLLALSDEQLVKLATTSASTVSLLTTATEIASANPAFHKTLVNRLMRHIPELAQQANGQHFVNAVASIPSKGKERSVPMHMKEAIMDQLANHEMELRKSWMGRNVWKAWKGDTYNRRRGEWKRWMKEQDEQAQSKLNASGPNGITTEASNYRTVKKA